MALEVRCVEVDATRVEVTFAEWGTFGCNWGAAAENHLEDGMEHDAAAQRSGGRNCRYNNANTTAAGGLLGIDGTACARFNASQGGGMNSSFAGISINSSFAGIPINSSFAGIPMNSSFAGIPNSTC
jgi:hypothetical protein